MTEVSLPFALLAGIVSFASPCFLPIVPVFVGYLVGADEQQRTRGNALRQSLAFVLGFSLVFTAIFASIGLVGWGLLGDHRDGLRIAAGLLMVVLGLHIARLVNIPLLGRSFGGPTSGRPAEAPSVRRSLVLGMTFGAGWTPCIGPILGGIISLAIASSSVWHGTGLLVAYCLGLGIPFVAVALGASWVSARLSWLTRHESAVQLVSGALLVITGFLVVTDQFSRLSGFGV
ncbi:cytochrome c biogenesis CcdA family protein [Luteococcus peritonei]|uniref:Cytochrome c biogenesis CcdA family protein n=1 Tax=Luteococcus peritonei TaxID=88874 RepID=A0ABW4S0U3_9ACTN